MNAQIDMQRIPLAQLQLSPRNARKTGGQDIEGLAASIACHGLLQNLTVQPGANDSGMFEVVAGGRRLAALLLLQREARLPHDLLDVPCKIIHDDDVALEASTAENTLREAMHPADQFTAFKGMIDAGKGIDDVAAHFGVPPIVVKQRLKLANVDPQLVQIYREDGMQLDQLQALALTDDHEAQRKAWFGPKYDHERSAWNLRDALTKGDVRASNSIARLVGLEAYEAAGGAVRRDMFSTRDDVWLCDRDLLSKLAITRLEEQRKAELADGWSWVEVHMSLDYGQRAAYGQLNSMIAEDWLPEDKQERSDAIQKRIAEIEAIDADSLPEIEADKLQEELQLLEDEFSDIQDQIVDRWPADAMAKAGVLIYIDDGEVHIERGRLQPGQKLDKAGVVTGTPKTDKPKKPSLSQDMEHRLDLHRAAAIREHIAGDAPAALQLLLAHMLSKLLTDSHSDSIFDITPHNQHRQARGEIESKFGDVGKSPARKALDDRIAAWKQKGMPTKASELLAWIGKRTADEKLQLLALATALTLNTNGGQRGRALAEQFKVDMTNWWTPSAESYVSLVPKALLAEAVADVAGKPAGEDLLTLKKDAAMATAAKRLANTGWLPKSLRGPGYALKKPGASKPAPAKKAANKAPAKKAVAKKPVRAKKAAKSVAKKAKE